MIKLIVITQVNLLCNKFVKHEVPCRCMVVYKTAIQLKHALFCAIQHRREEITATLRFVLAFKCVFNSRRFFIVKSERKKKSNL